MQPIILQIEKMTSQGLGLARHEGKVFFIHKAVPGDVVEIQIIKAKKDFNEGRVLKWIEKSSLRTEPLCPHYEDCGGCQMQHLNYAAQLQIKKEIVADALRRIARLPAFPLKDVIPSPKIWNYRNRIQVKKNKKGEWGYYRATTHDVIPIQECFIADADLNAQLKKLSEKTIAAESLELSLSSGQGFSQVNPLQNENLKQKVMEYLNPNSESLLADIYCGSGNFTFEIAKVSKKVWGLEKSETSLQKAKEESIKRNIKNITWMSGPAFKNLQFLQSQKMAWDGIVLDPPRMGVGEDVQPLIKLRSKKIVYVSCEPATFARDVSQMIQAGYELAECQPLDMFPQTRHIEVIGHLVLKN